MKISQAIKETLMKHNKKVEIIQWAITQSISSLVYSEYLYNMRQKQDRKIILVPKIKLVRDLLSRDSKLINRLSEELIDGIINNEIFDRYKDLPELILFNEENVEILKTIFDLYMVPNISRVIPEIISKKFELDDQTKHIFVEDIGISMFKDGINSDIIKYIIDETVLQLMLLLPSIKRLIELPENNSQIYLCDEEIMLVGNENAITPIAFDSSIYNNESVYPILSFVTNTIFKELDYSVETLYKNGLIIDYIVSTGLFNQVSIIRIE